MDKKDLVPKDRIGRGFVGESFLAKFSEQHLWYFLGEQKKDEVLFIKIFDSADAGAKCKLLHTKRLQYRFWTSC